MFFQFSALTRRQKAESFMALKVKGHKFFFIVDMSRGTFYNEKIYDQTVGMQRSLN